jgi:hypothetical protein
LSDIAAIPLPGIAAIALPGIAAIALPDIAAIALPDIAAIARFIAVEPLTEALLLFAPRIALASIVALVEG